MILRHTPQSDRVAFHGQPNDEVGAAKRTSEFSGLYFYYGYRFYDPVTGRWPSRDPIEERGGLNQQGFLANDPLNFIELLGLARIHRSRMLYDDEVFVDKYVSTFHLFVDYECGFASDGGCELLSIEPSFHIDEANGTDVTNRIDPPVVNRISKKCATVSFVSTGTMSDAGDFGAVGAGAGGAIAVIAIASNPVGWTVGGVALVVGGSAALTGGAAAVTAGDDVATWTLTVKVCCDCKEANGFSCGPNVSYLRDETNDDGDLIWHPTE